ncbi:MAG: GLUG motif-containing protein [Candidatus Cloacimonadales bacterium]
MKKIGLSLCLLLLMASAVFGVYTEIGDGVETTNDAPVNGWYDYSWSSYILTAEEIGQALVINEIQFNVNNKPNSYQTDNQQVYLRLTSESEIAEEYPDPANSDFTLVYDGSVTWDGSGWQGVEFDTAFSYDGTSNLQIVWENHDGFYSSGFPEFLITETDEYRTVYGYNDSAFYDGVDGRDTSFPNTRLGYLAEGAPKAATLLAPVDNSRNNELDTVLEWSLGENTDFVKVYLSTDKTAVNSNSSEALVVDGVLSTSFSPSLDTYLTYYWKVVASNSATEYTTQTAIFSFSTVLPEGLIQIGNGTEVNTGLPLEPYYGYSYSQTIYPQVDINSAGFIETIAWDYNGNSSWGPDAIKIYMGHTSETSFASSTSWFNVEDLTLVYDGTITVPARRDWVPLTLATPFFYNNEANLVIAVDKNSGVYYNSYDDFYCTGADDHVSLGYVDDTINPDPLDPPSGSREDYYPNLLLSLNTDGIGSVAGIITDGTNGLAGVNIVINETGKTTLSAADGSFEFPYVTVGSDYSLTASLKYYNDETVAFNVVDDEETSVNLTLISQSTVSISGNITSGITYSGVPATITLSGYDDFSTTADELGNYTLTNVWVNSDYSVEVAYLGYNSLFAELSVTDTNMSGNDYVLSELGKPVLTGVSANGAISLTWVTSDNSRALQGYNLYRDGVLLNPELLTEPSYIDSDVNYNEAYEYYVKNILDEGVSQPSDVIQVYAFSFPGNGSPETPYQIANLNDLAILSWYSTLRASHFIQTADIDASATEQWNEEYGVFRGFRPIGMGLGDGIVRIFLGSYNGNGYEISNLYSNWPGNSAIGLFGEIENANLSNITLVDVEIIGIQLVGGLVGYAQDYSTISNCSTTGSVGSVAVESNAVGGLVGLSQLSTINNSYSTCSVSGNSLIGGLVGDILSSTINNSFATGDVLAKHEQAGGLVGSVEMSHIYNSYATGAVSATQKTAGGLVGQMQNYSSIANCYSIGAVVAPEFFGGLIGYATDLEPSNSFWDRQTSGQDTSSNSNNYYSKTTAQMKDVYTYLNADWDFARETDNGTEDIWSFVDGDYPHLAWEGLFNSNFIAEWDYTYLGQSVKFINLAAGPVTEFLWDFGDGNTSTEMNPLHTYQALGTYTVSLTIQNESGSDICTRENYIKIVPGTTVEATISNLYISEVSDAVLRDNQYMELYNTSADTLSVSDISLRMDETDEFYIGFDWNEYVGDLYILPHNFLILSAGANRAIFEGEFGVLPDGVTFLQGVNGMLFGEGDAGHRWQLIYNESSKDANPIIDDTLLPVGGEGLTSYPLILGGEEWATVASELATPGAAHEDQTLPVTLSSFMAVQTSENYAQINWVTASENGVLGYDIYRAETEVANDAIRITPTLIIAENAATGASYSYTDNEVEYEVTYYYWLHISDFDGTSEMVGPVTVKISGEGDHEIDEILLGTQLMGNYPNPFNPSTTISFSVAEPQVVTIDVYNLRGQLVKRVLDKKVEEVNVKHNVVWNGVDANERSVASGIYFTIMKTGSKRFTHKIVLMK